MQWELEAGLRGARKEWYARREFFRALQSYSFSSTNFATKHQGLCTTFNKLSINVDVRTRIPTQWTLVYVNNSVFSWEKFNQSAIHYLWWMYNKAAFFWVSSRDQPDNERLTVKSISDTRQFRVTGLSSGTRIGGGVSGTEKFVTSMVISTKYQVKGSLNKINQNSTCGYAMRLQGIDSQTLHFWAF